MLSGQIISSVVGQFLNILQHEIQKGNTYKEALVAVKNGTIDPKNINLKKEPSANTPEMTQNLVRAIVQGYLPMIEEEANKAEDNFRYLEQIKKGVLDPQSVVITDDGVKIVPVLPPEPDDDDEDEGTED